MKLLLLIFFLFFASNNAKAETCELVAESICLVEGFEHRCFVLQCETQKLLFVENQVGEYCQIYRWTKDGGFETLLKKKEVQS